MSFEKQTSPISFDELTSNVNKIQKDSIEGIDIEQVTNWKSAFRYFKLEVLTLLFITSIFILCLFRDGPIFPEKSIRLDTLFILFLMYLRHTFIFTLFPDKEREYHATYEKVTGERLDKIKQIKDKFGLLGLLGYMIFAAIPFILFFAIAQV